MPEHHYNLDEGLVRRVVNATWWHGCGIERADAEQEARIAYWHCQSNRSSKFDSARDVPFAAWAWIPMQGAVRRAIHKNHGLSEELQQEIWRLSKCADTLAARLGRLPLPAELAQEVGIREARVIRLLLLSQRVRSLSLDEPLQEDTETTLIDTIQSSCDVEAEVVNHVAFEQSLTILSSQEREIILMSAAGYTPAEIANELKIPDGTVRSILSRARAKIWRHINEQ